MAVMSGVMLWGVLVSVCFAFSSADKQAKPGQTVILPCKTADNQPAPAVEWRRSDLESEYVLLFRDDRTDVENQHSSYKNRVDLQDRQMKGGDVSLVLKNVTTNDTGIYECKVQNEQSHTIKLIVQVDVPPSPENNKGSIGLIIGLVILGLVAAGVSYVIYKKKQLCFKNPNPPVESV